MEVGLNKIYDPLEIEKKKLEPEFSREYEGKYLGSIGNMFTSSQIQECIDLGQEFSVDKIPVSDYTLKSVGVDFCFSSSSTAIVELEHIKTVDRHIIRVIRSELIDKGDPNLIVGLCWDIWQSNGFMNTAYFVDGSNHAMVNLLKIRSQEPLNWDKIIHYGHNSNIKIRPINFSTEHKNMLSNLHAVITKGYLAIPRKYEKLIISLRTAYAKELSLDKKETTYDDLLDALRLALKGFEFK